MRYLYGRHPVEALLELRPRSIARLLVGPEAERGPVAALAQAAGVRLERASKDKLAELARSQHHQGLVAEAEEFAYAELDAVLPRSGAALVLALDSVQDPHNLGALIRSAECFGATGVLIPQDRAASVTATAVQSSAGAAERLPVARVVNLVRALEELKERGCWATGLAGEATEELGARVDLAAPTVLVVGSEGGGLRPLVRRACDRLVRIPMSGRTGSLNASVAGAIALFEAARQRSSRTPPNPLDTPQARE
jgi:23S rRNA (guanosine2251-2'-O)-methyltransferase